MYPLFSERKLFCVGSFLVGPVWYDERRKEGTFEGKFVDELVLVAAPT